MCPALYNSTLTLPHNNSDALLVKIALTNDLVEVQTVICCVIINYRVRKFAI